MSPSDIPAIHTDRLVLRGHRASDLESCVAMWTDPLVARRIGGIPRID